jgi:hypothetical protein
MLENNILTVLEYTKGKSWLNVCGDAGRGKKLTYEKVYLIVCGDTPSKAK